MSDNIMPPSIPPATPRRRPSVPPTEPPPAMTPQARRSVKPVRLPAPEGQTPPAARPRAYAPRQRAQQTVNPTPATRTPRKGVPTKPAKRSKRRWQLAIPAVALAILIGWPAWLIIHTNSSLQRVDALVPGSDSAGTTYLLAGSDSRADGTVQDEAEGERADSIMIINVAPGGQTSMISLPRDTYVDIPEYGSSKINAAYSYGGPTLLVETVQNLTGLSIDHYVEINMGGVGKLVDAVGGVNLCMDFDVSDPDSGLEWTAGCHDADGSLALAFARMRYQDPRGDLGRAQRQREVIAAVTQKALAPSTLLNPFKQLELSDAGTSAIRVDNSASVIDIGKLLLAFRAAGRSGLTGTPPLSSVSAETNAGSAVLLDEDLAPSFFERVAQGTLTQADFETYF